MEKATTLNREVNNTLVNPQISANQTVLNHSINMGEILNVGDVIGGTYTLTAKLNVTTGEADLYICSDGRESYVAKIYRRKIAIKEEVIEKLMAIHSPYVARVYATGEVNGFPYEIIPYYKKGSLEGKVFSYTELKTSIIPALNEGLKVLHDNGIIHKDLKPSNIMLADNGKDVAIIDFGISSIREQGNTVVVTQTGLTPEYSAPETFRNLFLNESDYYSMGITLYALYCGHTPYEQMGQKEIEQYVSIQKIPMPSNMEEELKNLIYALTYPDITNRKNKSNPNRRWGYEEIRKWCGGIKLTIPGEIVNNVSYSGNIPPYRFLGETYVDKRSLIEALAKNWNDGKKQLFRGLLSAYFKSFDAEIAGYCIDAEESMASEDEDILFLKTIYRIDSSNKVFYWKGNRYKDLATMGEELLRNLWNDLDRMNPLMDELLNKGVISQYILCMNGNDSERVEAVRAIESHYRAFDDSQRNKKLSYFLMGYMLSGIKSMYKFGYEFKSILELTYYMKEVLNRSYTEFEKVCNALIDNNDNLDVQFESWLIVIGKGKELQEWKQSL